MEVLEIIIAYLVGLISLAFIWDFKQELKYKDGVNWRKAVVLGILIILGFYFLFIR